MEEIEYIKSLTNQQIGNAISRLCVMADIDPPEDGKLIVEFLRDKFWKYEVSVIPKSFDSWMAGNYAHIMRVKKINMVFLSSILNEYIKNNWEKIKRYTPPAIEAPKPTPEEIAETNRKSLELTINAWLRVYRDKITDMLPLKMMEIHWAKVQNVEFPQNQIQNMVEWIMDYEKKYKMKIAKTMNNPNKAKRLIDTLNNVEIVNRNYEMYRSAAQFGLHVNQKYNIK